MYWKDGRLTHSNITVDEKGNKLEPLPISNSSHPGFPDSANKRYILLKDPEDIKRLWKPDVFIDQAIVIRWENQGNQCPIAFSGRQSLTMLQNQ